MISHTHYKHRSPSRWITDKSNLNAADTDADTSRSRWWTASHALRWTPRIFFFKAKSVTVHEASLTNISWRRGKIIPEVPPQRLRCYIYPSLRGYQSRRRVHRVANVFTFHRKRLLMLCMCGILMFVRECFTSRPTILVTFEPYDNVIQW